MLLESHHACPAGVDKSTAALKGAVQGEGGGDGLDTVIVSLSAALLPIVDKPKRNLHTLQPTLPD